jgi:hypothetical protein
MSPRILPLAVLLVTLATSSADGQSATAGGQYGGRHISRMHGVGRGTPPDPVVLNGPPAPAEFAALAKLPRDKTDQYTGLYDRFMAETKPQRDSLAAVRHNSADGDAGERASRQRRWDVFVPLNDELTRRQAAFDDALHEMLEKGQWKSYQQWRDQQRKDAEKARRDRWQHRGSDSVPPA